ncbi:hypothetical protein IJH72_01080 [Candidatus Saccharibacteria bacterium]|nr:hypothetical protein [Candidatus Saccharibacteria bacterium]
MDQGGNIEKKNNNLLIIILSFLILLVIILATIITINFVNKNPGNNPAQNSDTNLETALANFKEKYPSVEASDYENVISAYQSIIDSSSDENRIELLKERIYFIMDYDPSGVYKETALKDAYEIEEKQHDVPSAGRIVNIAEYYEIQDIYDEYSKIYYERMEESEANSPEKTFVETFDKELPEENEE